MQIHTAPDPYYLVSSFLPLSRGMAVDSIILPHYNLYKPKLKLPQSDCQAEYGWHLHYDTRNGDFRRCPSLTPTPNLLPVIGLVGLAHGSCRCCLLFLRPLRYFYRYRPL